MQDEHSHLFLVRFWTDGANQAKDAQDAQDHKEWSGRVQHVLSGEARTFHDWATLVNMLLEMAETAGLETTAQRAKIQEATT